MLLLLLLFTLGKFSYFGCFCVPPRALDEILWLSFSVDPTPTSTPVSPCPCPCGCPLHGACPSNQLVIHPG